MAEVEAKPLAYIPEVILKKRKSTEVLALRRKEQLEQRKFGHKKNKNESIKKPEEFVKEFRSKVTDDTKKIKKSYLVFVYSMLFSIIELFM